MWKVAMSEEVGKAVQSVLERVNQAAARRPKVTAVRGGLRSAAPCLALRCPDQSVRAESASG